MKNLYYESLAVIVFFVSGIFFTVFGMISLDYNLISQSVI